MKMALMVLSYRVGQFSYDKFRRGIIPQKMKLELWFLFSAHHLIFVYICTKCQENILNGIWYKSYEADINEGG